MFPRLALLAGFLGLLACQGKGKMSTPTSAPQDAGDGADTPAAADGEVVDSEVPSTDTGYVDAPVELGSRDGGSADAGRPDGAGGTVVDPFAGVTLRPDVDTSPVADCTGQPDLTLCNVVTTPDRWYDICVGGKCVSPGCGETSCNVPAPHFPIPANSNHQHLQVLPGPEPVVADLVTGLQWQGCDAGRTGETCATGSRQAMTWADALAYCDGLTWAGKDDWYLPDHWELESIDDWAKISDQYSLDPVAFPHPSNWYWSTHFASQSTVYAIQYRASTMVVIDDTATWLGFDVRCVRRGSSRNANYTTQRFARGAGTLTDAATGLIWQACASGRGGGTCMFTGSSPSEYAPSEAIAYCDNLVAGGFDDWRLPTYKELHSVLEFPPKSGTTVPKIVSIDGHRPYLLCRRSWEPNAGVLLISVTEGNPIIPNASSTYPIICVRGH